MFKMQVFVAGNRVNHVASMDDEIGLHLEQTGGHATLPIAGGTAVAKGGKTEAGLAVRPC